MINNIKKIVKLTNLFYNLILKYSSVDISINWNNSDSFIKNKLHEIADSSEQRYYNLSNFSLSESEIINKINNLNLENKESWINAVTLKDQDAAWSLYLDAVKAKHKNTKEIRDIVNYIESKNLSEESIYSEEDVQKDFIKIKEKLENNFNKLKVTILDAVSRISTWNNSNIKIVPNISDDDISIDEKDEYSIAAQIELININNKDNINPYFTIFVDNGKINIEDKLELGDEDFFSNNDVSSDYFSLIQELEIPGSSSKDKKKITLYTARPANDREMLLSTEKLPAGIFLTKSLSFAESFGLEYGQDRDVWKVTLNSKDLVQTLSGSGQEQYQLIREVTPISMQML